MFTRISHPRDLRHRRFMDDNEIMYTPEQTDQKKYKTFDLKTIPGNSVIGVVGRRGSGKSTLVRDIIRSRFKDITTGIVCSTTEVANPFYRKFCPSTFGFATSINETHLEVFIAQAKASPAEPKLFVVDDCAFSSAQRTSQGLRELIYNGRHYGVTVIIVAQSSVDIGNPGTRANVDIVFLTKENLAPAIEAAYKSFFSIFSSLRDFKAMCEKTRETPYKTIVADMNSFGKVTDMISVYVAKP